MLANICCCLIRIFAYICLIIFEMGWGKKYLLTSKNFFWYFKKTNQRLKPKRQTVSADGQDNKYWPTQMVIWTQCQRLRIN